MTEILCSDMDKQKQPIERQHLEFVLANIENLHKVFRDTRARKAIDDWLKQLEGQRAITYHNQKLCAIEWKTGEDQIKVEADDYPNLADRLGLDWN
jgi:alkyl hydroperoxide reductase subunit AhpC